MSTDREIDGLTQALDRQGCWLFVALLLLVSNCVAIEQLKERVRELEVQPPPASHKGQP